MKSKAKKFEINPKMKDMILFRYTELDNGCWRWNGSMNKKSGYGVMHSFGYGYVYAHRVSYLYHYGSLDCDLVIDHICRNRLCINPSHLRQVTQKVNILENSNSFCVKNKRKTECINGHEFSIENTIFKPNGYRVCRVCISNRRLLRLKLTKPQ